MAIFKLCAVSGCDNKATAKNVCKRHYARLLRHGDPLGGRADRNTKPPTICSVGGCQRERGLHGVCSEHYTHWAKHGFSVNRIPRLRRRGKSINSLGYVEYLDPEHPMAMPASGRVLEHRAIMAEKIGRSLLPGENVHHINGDRADNRPENLELWVTAQPAGQRPEDLVEWAQEILARYGPPPRP